MRYAWYFLLLFALPAMAKTPDGKPPSVETVCDVYKGAAFGLCNSYCEARDCDDPRVHAADRSCEVTAAKFMKLTGDEMPCDSAPPAACSITANDDTDADTNVLTNDKSSGSMTITGSTDDNKDMPITIGADGSYTWDGASHTITYTVCCDSKTCDTATLKLIAPA
jgi:hypothetical protein